MKKEEQLRLLSLFSGVGAFEKAITRLSIPYELVGFSEIDKWAITSYCAIHGVDAKLNLGDISKIEIKNVPDCDIITHGSPCTDYSIAGKGKGGDKDSGTRSSLMWYTVNIVEHKMPKYVIWENVKGVLSKKHKHNFDKYLSVIEHLGYNNYYKVLNAKDYGIPQNRERIFVVSIRKDIDGGLFEFPKPFDNGLRLKHMLEDNVDEKYYINEERCRSLLQELKQKEEKLSNIIQINNPNHFSQRVYSQEGMAPTIPAGNSGGGKEPCKIVCKEESRKDNQVINEEPNECKQVLTIPKEILNDNERQRRVYSPEGVSPTILARADNAKILVIGMLDMKGSEQIRRVYDPEGISPTIDTCRGGHREPKIVIDKSIKPSVAKNFEREKEEILKSDKDIYQCGCNSGWQDNKVGLKISPTIRAGNSHTAVLDSNYRIRKLTPLECWRLMGFDDLDYLKARRALEEEYYNGKDRSNSQMYKQAGNSIVVDVLEYIFVELFF